MWAVQGELDSGWVVTETWCVYNLQRGCTYVVVEGISASDDERWTAVGRGNGPFVCSRLICMVVSLISGFEQLALYYTSFPNNI